VTDRLAELGYTAVCGPELEFYVCERGPDEYREYAYHL